MPKRAAAPKVHPETSPQGLAAKAEAETAAPGAAEIQAAMDEATKRRLTGTEVDPTPNENYTVAGVLAGLPTPETHPMAQAQRDGVIRGS